MTSANTHASRQDGAASDAIEDVGTFQVLVSYYDGADFDGDWRWGADCPAVDATTDGRTREEAAVATQYQDRETSSPGLSHMKN